MTRTKKLENKRLNIYSQLTRLEDFLTNFTTDQFDQLKFRIQKCEELWVQFEEIQSEIEELKGENIQGQERATFESIFYRVLGEAKKKLSEHQIQSSEVHSRQTPGGPKPTVKLPLMEIPTFCGGYKEWSEFYDTFNTLIHSNSDLSAVQKFYYLKNSLKGDAADVLHSLEVSEDNYTTAWSLLRERFENKKLITLSHIDTLFNFPPIIKESHGMLRKLLDEINKSIRALKTLGQPVDTWDTLLIYILEKKLDPNSKREWQIESDTTNFSNLADFIKFLGKRCQLLEVMNSNKMLNKMSIIDSRGDASNKYKNNRSIANKSFATTKQTCVVCKDNHLLFHCKTFLGLPIEAKREHVRKSNLCWNCLGDHRVQNCTSRGCKYCGKKHNTLLHEKGVGQSTQSQSDSSNTCHEVERRFPSTNVQQMSEDLGRENSALISYVVKKTEILLSTALIYIEDKFGNKHECRALLDSASQSNFISKELSERLRINPKTVNIPIIGINQNVSNISGSISATIFSKVNAFRIKSSFLILDKIANNLPAITFKRGNLNIPQHLTLADNNFNMSGKIDLLIGAEIFWELLCVGQIKLGHGQPIMQKTKFGWIISGNVAYAENKNSRSNNNKSCFLTSTIDIQDQLKTFWEIEEAAYQKILTKEEQECERIFSETTFRNDEGRFVVNLPIKEDLNNLGNSVDKAIKRFYALERKMERNEDFARQYKNFIHEYEEMGHMSRIDSMHLDDFFKVNYYLPHHGVIKESSTTTKLRVVFDGSSETDTGVSINSKLMVGPKIQEDLFYILLRFRKHPVVLAGDVAKMYRQVLITKDHRDLQRIIWRSSSDQPIQHYRLNTVTYGTAPAAFLAVRCLIQLGIENEKIYPKASKAIMKDFYVDDLLTGANTVDEAKQLKFEITKILNSGKFTLRKWLSNNMEVLEDINENDETIEHYISEDKITKTLGIIWNSELDQLRYKVTCENKSGRVTKRIILSVISQIFDPLGLVGPAIIKAKRIMQRLWELKLSWDEAVPLDIYTAWTNFYKGIHHLNLIEIPRQAVCSHATEIQLHCFSDASEQAYGSSIYIRTTDRDNTHHVQLLCAKSRVSPLKTITLARLELCGALLMAQLADNVIKALDLNIHSIWYWCDSTIVLSWLAGEPSHYNTFVANRVAEIQRLTSGYHWNHVQGTDNPSDIISRGMNPNLLVNSTLWWKGPSWLAMEQSEWPETEFQKLSEIPELKKISHTFIVNQYSNFDIFQRFSSYHRLVRVTAFCIRFVENCSGKGVSGPLTVDELEKSFLVLIKLAQLQSFIMDLAVLKNNNKGSVSAKLVSLSPFLDDKGILRVGGRLNKADICYDQRHQIILDKNHKFTKLLIMKEHLKNLHAGPQALLATLRLRFWPIGGRNTVRSVLRNCITCFRNKPRECQYMMGELPRNRITPSRPFLNCGIDFAGPFDTKTSKIRGQKIVKSYLCIFVCFSTKACHLELVGDLSTNAFLNSFKRFFSRRGLPKHVYSDNGTNFVGANNYLKELYLFLENNGHQKQIYDFFAQQTVKWHFIPPRSPHFGGLWESGVRIAKYHLRRVLGNLTLTYEELYTVMTQVEACMNSRPILPLTEDPSDLQALTPGHFIIGAPLTALPEDDLMEQNPNRLTRYHHLTQIIQHFWKRWSREYLSLLQQRNKWQVPGEQVKLGDMVLVKEENLPPLKWQLARVIDLCSGKDNIIRVATVRTSKGIFKRALNKLCVLPVENDAI